MTTRESMRHPDVQAMIDAGRTPWTYRWFPIEGHPLGGRWEVWFNAEVADGYIGAWDRSYYMDGYGYEDGAERIARTATDFQPLTEILYEDTWCEPQFYDTATGEP